jgi:hypothetical protein
MTAVFVERFTIDVLHHQIGLAIFAMPCVKESRDIGMRQHRQNLAFGTKALSDGLVLDTCSQELDRDLLADLAIDAFSKINGAHPSTADERPQTVWAALRTRVVEARENMLGRLAECLVEPTRIASIEFEKRFDLKSCRRIHAKLLKAAGALFLRKVRQLVEEGLDTRTQTPLLLHTGLISCCEDPGPKQCEKQPCRTENGPTWGL